MRPHVGAVVINKDRDIADHLDRFLRAVISNRVPLLPEKKLQNPPHRQLRTRILPQFMQCRRIPARELRRPLTPIPSVPLAQKIEYDEVFQPPFVLDAESIEVLASI